MRIFKTKTKKNIWYTFVLIFLFVVILIIYYNKKLSINIIDVASTKLEEITNYYVKRNIVPQNSDVNDLININKNDKDEILYVDIDTEKANAIMVDIITKIQNNINDMEFEDKLLKKHNDNIYIELPISFSNGSLVSNLGPKIPVKLSFYEQVLASVDTEVTNYGINNALVKIYLTVDLEQKIYVPFKKEKFTRQYRLLLSAKMINGRVPSFLGGTISNQEVLNNS